MSWYFSRQSWATLFHMGLAAPAASLFSVIVCLIYFLYLNKQHRLYEI